jgi:plastocyanin
MHPLLNRARRSAAARLLVVALLPFAAGCGGASYDGGGITTPPPPGTPPTPVATTSVTMRNIAFNPPAIVVSPGATVTFTNEDGFGHTVVFSSGGVTSIGEFSTGSRTANMPTAAGTYNYHCSLHGGMEGTVTVQ